MQRKEPIAKIWNKELSNYQITWDVGELSLEPEIFTSYVLVVSDLRSET